MAEKAVKMEAKAEQPPKMATRKPPRQMAAKACERCRRRKIKCDEFFPCGQCTRMRVQCKIEDPAEKRREQQQSAMEDRIKRLEALLIATYSNPNNHLDMNNAGIDLEGLLPGLGGNPQAISQGAKMEPPRLTLQTPASPDFRPQEPNELLSAGGYAFGFPYWSPPPSIAQSAPASASDYYPSDLPPWSTVATQGGSNDSTPPGHSPRPIRTRTSSMSTSEASQDDMRSPILGGDRNRLSVDTSGSTLAVPQIAITSWDQSRPQSPAPGGVSPALSPQGSVLDIDMSFYDPPELSVGSWSGLSSPSIMAPIYPYEDHLSVTNQSLPSHSRRSSINSLNPDYEMYNSEPKRRRAASDLLPFPQQFVYPDSGTNSEFFTSPTATPQNRPGTPNLFPLPTASPIIQPQRTRQDSLGSSQGHQHKEDLITQTFTEVIYPLFPLLSSASQQQPQLSPKIAQTQTYLVRAISTHLLSLRPQSSAQAQKSHFTPQEAQGYFSHAMYLHGPGKWDSLPGIQSGILLALYMLLSSTSFQPSSAPNLYLLNATIVAACLDLGLHCRNLNDGALEGNTLLAAYVLDKTIARIRARPPLLKETDLSSEVLLFVKKQLAERSRNGSVRRFPEAGRLWEWWVLYEDGLRAGNVEIEMDALAEHDYVFSG